MRRRPCHRALTPFWDCSAFCFSVGIIVFVFLLSSSGSIHLDQSVRCCPVVVRCKLGCLEALWKMASRSRDQNIRSVYAKLKSKIANITYPQKGVVKGPAGSIFGFWRERVPATRAAPQTQRLTLLGLSRHPHKSAIKK